MIRINNIHIKSIGPIRDLNLEFNPSFNIICGQNGIGKTTILNCLAQTFSGSETSIKKNSKAEIGIWETTVIIDSVELKHSLQTDSFHPNENKMNQNGLHKNSNDVIYFKTQRDIPYVKLDKLSKDEIIANFFSETITGSKSNGIKNWIVNRYLFSAQSGSLDENQIKNFELLKSCFSLLDENIKFNRVIPSSFDIMLFNGDEEIYFEYLSSGFKSCLAIIIGVIMEVELRHKTPFKYVLDFDGVILIDEVDLHLHPEWQAKIYLILKQILPNAQIFSTTHSPHIIQIAQPNEIIALVNEENKNIKINPLLNTEYGCQGWSVEEILRDVMGMSETRTSTYSDAIFNFNKAIENDDFATAKTQFKILDAMLHPENSLKKILKIQLTGLSEND
jgi:predicted ATP-binding protein involved in virulence